jgi:hypothetical protein
MSRCLTTKWNSFRHLIAHREQRLTNIARQLGSKAINNIIFVELPIDIKIAIAVESMNPQVK